MLQLVAVPFSCTQICCWCRHRVQLPGCCLGTPKSSKELFWSIWVIYKVQHESHGVPGHASAQGSPELCGTTEGQRGIQAASPQPCSARYHLH